MGTGSFFFLAEVIGVFFGAGVVSCESPGVSDVVNCGGFGVSDGVRVVCLLLLLLPEVSTFGVSSICRGWLLKRGLTRERVKVGAGVAGKLFTVDVESVVDGWAGVAGKLPAVDEEGCWLFACVLPVFLAGMVGDAKYFESCMLVERDMSEYSREWVVET